MTIQRCNTTRERRRSGGGGGGGDNNDKERGTARRRRRRRRRHRFLNGKFSFDRATHSRAFLPNRVRRRLSVIIRQRAAGNVHSLCGTGSIHFHVSIGDPVRFSNASALHLQLASGLVNIFSYLAILDGLCIMRLTSPAPEPEAFAPSPAIFSYLWRLSA